MEFDHSYTGSAAWSFPSPGTTPTNASFDGNVFQTPKTAAYHPSHFQDAFSTPQIPYHSTPQQFEYSAMTSGQRPQTSSGTLQSNIYGNGQSFGGHVSGQGMMPTTQAAGYTTYRASAMLESQATKDSVPAVGTMSFDSSQMQTPPPTRGTSARQLVPSQHAAFGTPSSIASRRITTPQQGLVQDQAGHMFQQAPVPLPYLQFSPDAYQFGNLGPASAPVQSQSQVLWSQHSPVNAGYQQQFLADPFAPASSDAMHWPSAHVPTYFHTPAFDTPAMASFPILQSQTRPMPAVPFVPSSVPVPITEVSSAGVNPSLLYSSPIRANVEPIHQAFSDKEMQNDAFKPVIDNGRQNRSSLQSSQNIIAVGGPKKLARSNTVGSIRPSSAGTSSLDGPDHTGRDCNPRQPPRTASPFKRVGIAKSLGSMSESKKLRHGSSVVLTIDEHGTARAENRLREDSLTKSAREKYPGIFDSDSSDAESDTSETPSRNASFSFSFSRNEERRSKAARLEAPVENLEGLSIPRSSSSASNKVPPSRAVIAAAAQLRRASSVKRRPSSRNDQRRAASFTTTAKDEYTTERSPERAQTHISETRATLDDHNRRWSIISMVARRASQSASPQHASEELPFPSTVGPHTRNDL